MFVHSRVALWAPDVGATGDLACNFLQDGRPVGHALVVGVVNAEGWFASLSNMELPRRTLWAWSQDTAASRGDCAATLEAATPTPVSSGAGYGYNSRHAGQRFYGLGKLLDRSLRGMFDGPTTVHVNWEGPGIVLDLSAVHHDPDALTLVMIAVTAWLQAILANPDGPRRLQVLDEAWSLLGSERTTKYLQAC